ncbi:hypothetical protein TNIN_250491 [Trichonephila inaurata madagascariensis]|uniref:Uncharacterized protein n=1 Tax=Trichonephila inaurata madagascariensis TaxID=2747483 RepID=A0A8X6XHW6_9ARAC|nr:hypothetical protein TNIN_250491 [Trichonephila inaurata madagascariensis]
MLIKLTVLIRHLRQLKNRQRNRQSMDTTIEGQTMDTTREGQAMDTTIEEWVMDTKIEGQTMNITKEGWKIGTTIEGQTMDTTTINGHSKKTTKEGGNGHNNKSYISKCRICYLY